MVTPQSIKRVVLISVDTLRADYLGSYNLKMKTSPELDHFASQNIVFLNVTSQAPTTAPSHKSIFYSVYPSIHKTTIRTVPQEKLRSPIEIIRAQGFKTAAFTGGGQLNRTVGFARGFDTYWEPLMNRRNKNLKDTEIAAFDWLDQHYNDKFFLFLHTYEVHCPYNPPADLFLKWASWYKGEMPKNGCNPNYDLPHSTVEDYDYVRSLYSAEVNYIDGFVGNVFRKLKSLGIYDETLIIFLSDHGESLGENDYFGHSQLYQMQLHVPLILHIPGVESAKIDTPIELIDIMPTIFNLLGIQQTPYPFQGKSLLSLIREPRNFDKKRPLISEERGRIRIRIEDFALSFFPEGEAHEELFNLRTDPKEMNDISDQNPKTVAYLKDRYLQMKNNSKSLSAQFILDPRKKPEVSEETIEQLKALGYIAQ
jgi:arylsulfatase A-like enzyme